MGTRILQRAFSAGEITPELYGRLDLNKRQDGLALCRNFITLPHGPAINRPGTEYVATVRNPSQATRVIPFSYNNTQTFVIELGAGYFRWKSNAASLLYSTPAAYNGVTAYAIGDMAASGGVNYYCVAATTGNAPPNVSYWYAMPTNPNVYEIPNPYAAADLMDIHYVQSADVMTLVHPSYPPMELRRYGATNWQTTIPSFVPPANALTTLVATPTGAGATVYSYVVTAVKTVGLEESAASAPFTCTNNLVTAGNFNTITFTDPSAAGTNVRYYVYKLLNGLYGYVGQCGSGTGFKDDNITPDATKTPPISDTSSSFTGAGNYPAAVSYYQQRRLFGGTNNLPQNLWATRSGTESNMSYSIPVQSDNRIAIRIAAREASAIRHIIPTGQLLLFTASCEWKCGSASGDVLTPSSISVAPQSYIGSSNVSPVVVNNIVLYGAARGGHIRELSYSWQASSFISGDLSLMAPHLFDYKTIVDMAYSRGPIPTLWAVSSGGELLGMTYVPEQQVSAWHHHDTGASGVFESCCVITENNEDMLYLVVRRTVNGSTTRYIERLHTRQFDTLSDAFFVDCGATYTGAPTKVVNGLTWLEGQTVNILGDGATFPPKVVTGGSVSLDQACSKITVGLPITAQVKTLPAVAQIDGGYGQGRQKNISKIWLRVVRSSGILAGPSFDNLVPFKQRTIESYGSPPALVDDEVEIVVPNSWGASGQVCIQQTDPLPLDLTSVTVEVAIGA